MSKDEFNRLFGEFIRKKRLSKAWTQNDLADKINNDFQNISRLERGLISPTLYWLTGLAKAFEQPLSDMIQEFERFTK